MDYNTLLYEVKDHVGTITLNRPEQKNALNVELLSELFGLLQDIRRNEDIKILIITGKGNAFAAGADIKMFAGVKEAFEARSISIVNNPIHELPRLDIPVVAAVNGPALGGGCELALACDHCLASEKALFGQPEINLGLIPGSGGTQRLPRLIGVRRAMELLFTGDTINAEEAYRIGLVNKVVP
jgi:enoyl-CoA hydratase